MMLLLPIQWTWAAAAAYCAHEPATAAVRHIGHHEHVHKSTAAESSKDGQPAKSSALDLDCEYCHLSASQWLPALHDVVPAAVAAFSPLEDPLLAGSHVDSGPDRPDWLLAV